MADKNSVTDWSETAADNDNVGGVPLGENVMLPSDVNNAFRVMMSQIKTLYNTLINAVLFTAQSLTAAQQGQARANIGTSTLSGFRNKILNGDFEIADRGASFSPASNGYTLNQWALAYDGSGSVRSVTRVEFGPGAADAPGGCHYYIGVDQTTAGSGATYNSLFQKIEDVRLLAGKKVTVTFYAKWESGIATLPLIYLAQNFGTGGSSDVVIPIVTNLVVPGAFTKYSYVVDVPSIVGKTIGDGSNLRFEIALPINAISRLLFAHVSIVEGDATAEADPFSPRHIQQETALCQRYYEVTRARIKLPSGAGGVTCIVPFKVQKRVSPTLSGVVSPVGGATVSVEAIDTWAFNLVADGGGSVDTGNQTILASAEL